MARQFHVPRSVLRRRLNGVGPRGGNHAANAHLNEAEEEGLCRHIEHLDDLNIPIRKEFVAEAANSILQKRRSANAPGDAPRVGQRWVTRFIQRHNFLIQAQKIRDKERHLAEDEDIVKEYFQKLQNIIQKYGITPESIWNMDETGFQIGVGKSKMVVTRRQKRTSYLGVPTNRESATAIECISAAGEHIPAFLILSGKVHQSGWYKVLELANETIIALSESGFSNDHITFEWLKHFDDFLVNSEPLVICIH